MTYRILHKTTYKYKSPVSLGNHIACLTPRSFPYHVCTHNRLRITPAPASCSERVDYFGNELRLFMIQEPHEELVVEARSEVTIDERSNPWPAHSPAWEDVVRFVPNDCTPTSLEAYQFIFDSPRIRSSSELGAYAARSFKPGRQFAEGLLELTARIHADFHFDAKATNVRTPTEEVFRKRRGVCQDFAHLQIACLRSVGLAARYVSGYLRTYSSLGRSRLIGANVSHAWVSAYCPGVGWLDVDPTNNLVPSTNHVTIAWGRDYGDVSPLRGLILGGRDHTLKVAVKVEPGGVAT
jgi:transglutaminase-like putative cysteine protease